MELVVVERSFEQPAVFAEVAALEEAVASCLEDHEVKFLFSYFSRDRRHMTCFYRAPDAEAVRTTQQQGKLPVDKVWNADKVDTPAVESPEGYSIVVVQRLPPMKVGPQEMTAMMEMGAPCMDNHRVQLKESYLARAGDRVICVYYAPDAETVRKANQEAGLPVERAWTASHHAGS